MTPKEKAKELVSKYNDYLQQTMGCIVYLQNAKQCAIIAIDEMIETITPLIPKIQLIWFWQEVKQEIEKL